VKKRVAVLFCGTYFFYYWARYNYPVALPSLRAEFGFDAAQLGMIASALTLGYAVGQLVNGALVDRRGPRLMMTLGGLGAMMANYAMGGSSALAAFLAAWLANGYFQSMGYPSTLKLVVNWFGPGERGRAVGASEFWQGIAALSILPVAGWLATLDWRLVFYVPGALLGLASVAYWLLARDGEERPEPTPLLPDLARRYGAALLDWRLDAAYLSYGACQFVRYAMLTWIPLYLVETTGMGIFKAALGGATFQLGGSLGSVLVGWLADRMPGRRWLLIAAGMALSGAAGAAVGLAPPGWGTVVALFACGVGIEALEVAYFLMPAEHLGRDMAATGVGVMNATGKAVASLQGVVLGGTIDALGYGAAFGLAGAFGLLAAVLILPMRRAR
jgi:MFS transporter, OPA family, glycerol-3-phosphate transporter